MPGLVSITTPPATTALTLLATAKGDLNVTTSTDDAFITNLIDRASGIVSEYCGWPLGKESIVETFRFGTDFGIGPANQQVAPYGTPLNVKFRPLILQYSPVVTLTSVVENGVTLTAGTDYEIDAPAGLIYRLRTVGNTNTRSWWNIPTVVVTYDAGYALPGDSGRTLPRSIEDICLTLVRSAYLSRGFDTSVVMDWTPDLGRTQYTRSGGASVMGLDDATRAQLAPFVLRVR
jgi:hypothetical protein